MDFSWVPILSIYCIYTAQSCLKEPSKTWTYLDYFPVLDSFGWWDSGLVALEVALLHRHLKALHISAVTRIGALQQQVLGLHLPKQRPHMLRRDILPAQLLDHHISPFHLTNIWCPPVQTEEKSKSDRKNTCTSYISLHLPISPDISLHLPASPYIFLHLPASPYIFLHLPTSSYIFLHLPASPYIFLHLPASPYIFLHLRASNIFITSPETPGPSISSWWGPA